MGRYPNFKCCSLKFGYSFTVQNTRILLKVLSGKQRKPNNLSLTSAEKANSILYKGLVFNFKFMLSFKVGCFFGPHEEPWDF